MKKESFCRLAGSGIPVGRQRGCEEMEEEEEDEEDEEEGSAWLVLPRPPLLVLGLELDGLSLREPFPLM